LHEIPILTDLLIIFGLAIPVIYTCHKLHIPSLVGLLITGIMIGPNALVVIESQHEVEILAEIGIILLLFVIGLEFSLEELSRIQNVVLLGGTIQVLGAIGITSAIAIYVGFPVNQAVFLGFLVALSSTAIVLKMMQDRGEFNTQQGQNMLGILIYQDVAIVPLILLTPFLAGTGQSLLQEFSLLFVAGVATALLVVVLARYVVPHLLHGIASTRQRDLFLISVVFLVMLICWFTAKIGLSLSLGAFLAGLIISESEYSHEAIAHVVPFRDVFTSLFFVSMGILLNPFVFVDHPGIILILTAIGMGIGTLTAGLAILVLGYPLSVAFAVSVGLNQIGEFSLILSKVGLEYNLLSPENYQLFLAVAVLSMMLTPFEYRLVTRIMPHIPKISLYDWFSSEGGTTDHEVESETLSDHIIVVGYGPTGQTVVEAAERADLPNVIVELNPNTVHELKKRDRPVLYGDAGQEAVLNHLNVQSARALVVTIGDPAAEKRIVRLARSMNPDLYILARTRFISEVDQLKELGADEIISEELETSLNLFENILRKYLVTEEEIERISESIRKNSPYHDPGDTESTTRGESPTLSALNVVQYEIGADSPLINSTLNESGFRETWQITVGAIQRDGSIIHSPDPSESFREGDVLVLLGKPDDIRQFREKHGDESGN
jgi:CPA2 family monovalent cation:H+ antiporter-2